MCKLEPIVLLSEDEARATIDLIKENIKNTRRLIVDFYEREGWRSLGYQSFLECIHNEFAQSASYVYRQLSAGQMEKSLPIGDIGDNRESHLRMLAILETDEQKERAWMIANAMSDKPTAEAFSNAAKHVWVMSNGEDRIRERMVLGELSPEKAYQITKSLDDKPAEFVRVAENVSDPSLVPMLYRLYHDQSDTWTEIALTGHIPSVDEQIPIVDAARQNLAAYLNIASNEHRAYAIELGRERYNLIRECVEDIIREARTVDPMEYPGLAYSLSCYDDATRFKGG